MKTLLTTLAVGLLGIFLVPALASAETYVVDTLEDSTVFEGCQSPYEPCSLRDAIERSNESLGSVDTIEFGLAGGTIGLESQLPPITDPLTIDGTSADDYAGTPVIEIDASPAAAEYGLRVASESLEGADSEIRALSITGAIGPGILVDDSEGVDVCSNYIGVDTSGAAAPNGTGILVGGDAFDTTIGTAGCRNLISGNEGDGIVDEGLATFISGNLIGTDADGNAALPNEGSGIEVTTVAGSTAISPGGEGGSGPNTIAFNQGAGVRVADAGLAAAIYGNSIFANGGLGIEIEENPPPVPTIESVQYQPETEISGTLSGEPDTTYYLDFYANQACDPSGAGEGQTYLQDWQVTTDGSGLAEFTAEEEGAGEGEEGLLPIPGEETVITATATTEVFEVGETTSEFSQCFEETQTFAVNTFDDETNGPTACLEPGDCSLRDAILRANETAAADEIVFDDLFNGTIELEAGLPPVLWPVTIDATTAADYSDAGHPVIVLDGSAVSEPESRGIVLTEHAGGSRVEGLSIGGFRLGVFSYSTAPNQICGNYIGVLPDGVTAFPNEYAGISNLPQSKGLRIGAECAQGNLISGNIEFGILEVGEGTLIKGNRIGVDVNGDPLPNGEPLLVSSGIELNAATKNPVIGGTLPSEANVIANNAGPGIRVRNPESKASIRGNTIYANSEGGIEFSAGDPAFSTFVEGFAGSTWFGHLSGAEANAEYEVDFFTNSKCDSSGKGQGEFYLGSTTVATDAGGEAEWAIDAGSLAGIDAESFTATVTAKATGETSQFSDCARTRPDTSLLTTPPLLAKSANATFTFSGSDLGHIDHFECSLDSGPSTTCASPYELTDLSDGAHTITVTAIDGEGFFTFPVPSYSWTVDTTAPTTQIDSAPSNPSSDATPSFTFSGSDPGGSGVAGFECKLDAGSFEPCTSPADLGPLGDGPHSFEVRALDAAGNPDASPSARAWTIDTVVPGPPVLQATDPASPAADTTPLLSGTAGAGTTVSLYASGECSGAPITTTATPAELAAGIEVTVAANSVTEFSAKATSAALLTSACSAPLSYREDSTAPSSALDTTPPDPSSSAAASFAFSGSDPGGSGVASFECKLDAGGFEPCTSPKSYAGLGDGSHTFEVRAIDAAGLTDATPAAYTWVVDSAAPDTQIDLQPANPSPSTEPTFAFSGTDPGGSGVASFECKLDAGGFEPCASPKSLPALADGSHTFEVRAIDAAANVDPSPASRTWVIDTAVPDPPVLQATDPASPAADTAPLLIGTAPANTGVSIYASADCSGAAIATTSAAEFADGIEVPAAANAVTEYSATATSLTLFTSACSAPLSYREDSTPPSSAIEATPPSTSSSNAASFSFGGSDPGGSGVTAYECKLDADAFEPCTSPVSYSGLGEGSHTFTVRAIDGAGLSEQAPQSYTWTVAKPVESSGGAIQQIAALAPENGETVAVAPAGGKVFVQRPGQKKPTELKEGQTIPVGSIVDATDGKVTLTSVNKAGETQTAVFYGGKFLVAAQESNGLVVLKLRGALNCANARASGATASAGRKGRRLWGSGKGKFRTEGNYGSATVRGTVWLTEDRCTGTFFKVRRGVVTVRDFSGNQTFSLPKGKSYLAQP